MNRRVVPLAAVSAVGALAVGVAGAFAGTSANESSTTQVCALLPDTTTSVRYVLFDAPTCRRPSRPPG